METPMTGIAEAERQQRVARALYAEAGPRLGLPPWEGINLEQRRPWIDRACQPPHIGS